MLPMRELEQYYRILELEPGASPEEVHQSYKDMVLVWHPDRFANHPRLQQKAHAKIKEINEARERLQAVERNAKTIAVAPKSSPKTKSPEHSQATAQDFYQQRVTRSREGDCKRTIEDYVTFSYGNKYDNCVWLD
jgi:curved DNA-binding protein CbpA